MNSAEIDGECQTDGEAAGETDTSHLDGVEDGCGCTEVWEHLSEQRDE